MAKGKKGQRPVRCLGATRWRGIKVGSCGVSDFAARVGVKVVKRKGPSLGMEVQRMKYFETLKRKLKDWCTVKGEKGYPSMAFERWWYSTMSFNRGRAEDPLLPVPEAANDPALLADLEQVGFSNTEAKQMIRRLHSSSAAFARNLEKLVDETMMEAANARPTCREKDDGNNQKAGMWMKFGEL
eukprot:symbB.v1.2.010574.t1/scaffold695.1/size172077/2